MQLSVDGVWHVYSGTSAGTLHETYWGGPNGVPRTTYQLGSVGSSVTSISTQIS
jgi:hypothetical protein